MRGSASRASSVFCVGLDSIYAVWSSGFGPLHWTRIHLRKSRDLSWIRGLISRISENWRWCHITPSQLGMLENWFQEIVRPHSSRCENPRSSRVDWKFNIQPLTINSYWRQYLGRKEMVGMLGEGMIINTSRGRCKYVLIVLTVGQRRQKASAGDHNHTEKIGKKTSWMNGR